MIDEQFSLGMDMSGVRYTGPEKDVIRKYLEHYRKVGFPYIKLTDEEKLDEFQKLRNLETSYHIVGPRISSDSTGVTLANSYHPHRFGVVCNDHRTALYIFGRDHLFEKCIAKCFKMNKDVTDSKLRSMISIFEGVQVASNFPPGTAKAIYEYFLPNGGTVWDMSCGFGGRLLAALSTSAVERYFGTDPSVKTFEGIMTMYGDIWKLSGAASVHEMTLQILNQGSEEILPEEWQCSVDLCFTSPPYFNTEKYAREESQSFLRYPYQDMWINKFIRGTMLNCLKVLKPNGRVAVNIANVNTFKHLENEFVRCAEDCGLQLIDTKRIYFSTMPGKGKRNRSEDNTGDRSEPLFIFKAK